MGSFTRFHTLSLCSSARDLCVRHFLATLTRSLASTSAFPLTSRICSFSSQAWLGPRSEIMLAGFEESAQEGYHHHGGQDEKELPEAVPMLKIEDLCGDEEPMARSSHLDERMHEWENRKAGFLSQLRAWVILNLCVKRSVLKQQEFALNNRPVLSISGTMILRQIRHQILSKSQTLARDDRGRL